MRYLIAHFAEKILNDKQRKTLDSYFRRGRHSQSAPRFQNYVAWAGTSGMYA